MDNSDNKVELTLIRKDETNAKELQELENNRKKMHEEIMTRNYNEDYYTLKANGLVPYGVITDKEMQEWENTLDKQYEVEKFVSDFNQMTKSKRKEFTHSDILEIFNGTDYQTIYDKGINIYTVSSLTLHSIKEIVETLDVIGADNKIVENENVKLLYTPYIDKKYKIVDVNICVFVTNKGMYNLAYKWNVYV